MPQRFSAISWIFSAVLVDAPVLAKVCSERCRSYQSGVCKRTKLRNSSKIYLQDVGQSERQRFVALLYLQ